jgi:hypothetical protein
MLCSIFINLFPFKYLLYILKAEHSYSMNYVTSEAHVNLYMKIAIF